MSLTTDPKDPRLIEGQKNETGQHEIYLVLSEEERAKGFVRPLRNSYIHVGRYRNYAGIDRMLTEDEQKQMMREYPHPEPYVAVLGINGSDGKHLGGTYVTQKEFDAWKNGQKVGGCGTRTTMTAVLAETYARNPKFYGATYCYGCGKHLPVEEFVWDGTNEEVGSLGPEFDDKGNIKGAKVYDKPAQLAPDPEPIVPTSTPVPLPVDLDDALQILSVQLENDLEDISKMSEDDFLCGQHHGMGRFLRNEWGLWGGSDIQRWFKNKGIHHADDMSSIILTSFHRRLKDKDIGLDKQIKKYRKYWNNHNPNVNEGIL